MSSTVPSNPSISPPLVRFGVFEADLRSRELRRNGIKVKIQDLPFRALTLFLSRPNEVLSRDDFRQTLWPDDVFVDFDRSITTAINRLRDALDDSATNPRFIETLDRRGYRWIAPTHIPEPAPETAFEPAPDGKPESVAADAAVRSPRWKFLIAALVVALLAALSMVWGRHEFTKRNAKANVLTAPIAYGSASVRPSADREAEEFYLKGRYYWEKRTPDSLNKAVDSFTQAIVHDPGYAPAYVGLADCYNLLREYTLMAAPEAYPRALAAARKAVELDPQSSEAHAALAFASFYGTWDAATADREFRRAIELNPDNAIAHHWYATYLASLRRYSESLAEIERAQALEPASKSVLADKGNILFNAGHRKEAIVLLQQMETAEPDFISPHRYLKFIYLLTADYSHYLTEARKEADLMHDSSALAIADATERAFAAEGGKGLLATLSAEQKRLYDRGLLSPFLLATTYSLLGNKPAALHYLKIAYDQRVDGVVEIESNHIFDNLANEPAFRKMLADAGLPALS